MERALTLISHHLCPYVQRAAIALAEKGIAFERVNIDLAAKPDWFKAVSPLGKVPVLRVSDADGEEASIFESAVILEYLEETSRFTTASRRSAATRAAPRLDRVRLAGAQRHRPLLFGDGRGDVRARTGRRWKQCSRGWRKSLAKDHSSPARNSAWSTRCSRRCSAISTASKAGRFRHSGREAEGCRMAQGACRTAIGQSRRRGGFPGRLLRFFEARKGVLVQGGWPLDTGNRCWARGAMHGRDDDAKLALGAIDKSHPQKSDPRSRVPA